MTPTSPTPPTTGKAAPMSDATPWDASRLAAVLTAAVYEHFTERLGPFTFSAHGRDETYDLLDSADDDDVLTFERRPDGARFEVEFWVSATCPVATQIAPEDRKEAR
jgi:hypothetical protein